MLDIDNVPVAFNMDLANAPTSHGSDPRSLRPWAGRVDTLVHQRSMTTTDEDLRRSELRRLGSDTNSPCVVTAPSGMRVTLWCSICVTCPTMTGNRFLEKRRIGNDVSHTGLMPSFTYGREWTTTVQEMNGPLVHVPNRARVLRWEAIWQEVDTQQEADVIDVPYTVWGDYVPSTVERSNFRALVEDYPDTIRAIYGDYGSHCL